MTKKIIFSGGGTGGHIFPAINLMKHFSEKGYDVILVTDYKGNSFISDYFKFKSYIISTDTPTNKNFIRKIFSLFVIFGLYCSITIGITYDEFFHIENGESRLRYLFSLGYYDYYYTIPHLRYYPGFYDTFSALITSAFPKSILYL